MISTQTPAIKVTGLRASYQGVPALQDVSFAVRPATMTAIVGPNGAGKSTLVKTMLDLMAADGGAVTFLTKPIGQVRQDVAYVPQRSSVDWTFPISVFGTALQGTYPRLGLLRRPTQTDRELARKSLRTVGLEHLAERQVGQLSSGQQQRMFLARALAQQARVIILDEPFVGVDATSEELIVKVLHDLRDQGTTIMVVHHDLTTAGHYYDSALLINRSVLAHGPVSEVLTQELLNRAYHPELSLGTDT